MSVHGSHCCRWHGCKYGDENCPVANGKEKQLYLCEYCYEDLEHEEYHQQALKNIAEIPNIEAAALWHHERMDGKGYPDGLKGDEIPKFVRIISVADSYDAMSYKRSYRDMLPQDYILGELEKGKGAQFDPEVAEAMIQLIKEDGEYMMKGI